MVRLAHKSQIKVCPTHTHTHSPPNGKEQEGTVGGCGAMTNGNGDGGADVTERTAQGFFSVRRVGRDPDDVLRFLGAFAEGGGQAVRAFAGGFAVVQIDNLLEPARGLECRGTQVAPDQLVCFVSRPLPHFTNIHPHDFTRSG